MSAFSADYSTDFDSMAPVTPPTPSPLPTGPSPISAEARRFVRTRATEVMQYQCVITRGTHPDGYDEDTLIYTPEGLEEVIYQGRCRIWELASAASVVVGDTDIYQQTTQLSIPWDESAVIRRYDEVRIVSAPQDSQMVGKRYEIQTVAKAGELRATRRFEVTGVM